MDELELMRSFGHQMLRDSRISGNYRCWGCGLCACDHSDILTSTSCTTPLTV